MSYFTSFASDISQFSLPEKFTFPFNYIPEPIAEFAAKELQAYIKLQIEPLHNFGWDNSPLGIGKMFGVLVVRNSKGEVGYISAFSGKLGMKNEYDKFVPPVYDMLLADGFYKEEELRSPGKSNACLSVNKLVSDFYALSVRRRTRYS